MQQTSAKEVEDWEFCKKLKFDHPTKCYMHKPESALLNGTHKILWDFEIQMDHLIPARRPMKINQKSEFAVKRILLS